MPAFILTISLNCSATGFDLLARLIAEAQIISLKFFLISSADFSLPICVYFDDRGIGAIE